jgi:hypothetical protein
MNECAAMDCVESAWKKHITGALRKFLKTAVVIDNEPWLKSHPGSANTSQQNAPVDDGMGAEYAQLTAPDEIINSKPSHAIDLKEISDAFSDCGIACAFVLPDNEIDNDDEVKSRVIKSADVADMVVIDWHLKAQSPALTLDVLESIAQSDFKERGRLRLVCIYTGEPVDGTILKQVGERFYRANYKIDIRDDYFARNENCVVVVCNKDSKPQCDLPEYLIENAKVFSDGLLPSFALASVGAFRKHMHHILTQFGSSLDAAYVSNFMLTNPSDDVSELLKDLLIYELDKYVDVEGCVDNYLSKSSILKWINEKSGYFSNQEVTGKIKLIDKAWVCLALESEWDDNTQKLMMNGQPVPFPEATRNKLSHFFYGDADRSTNGQAFLSKLALYKYDFSSIGMASEEWLPRLSPGSILKSGGKYLMCITPACDCVRLKSETPFLFIEGESDSVDGKANLIVTEGGNHKGVFFDYKRPVVKTLSFKPDVGIGRVVSAWNGKFYRFVSECNEELTWVGELRYSRVTSEVSKVTSILSRIGVSDIEYMRLSSMKKFPF